MRMSDWSSDVCSSDLHWSDFGISLKEKIACALKVLDPEEHNRDLKQPRNGLSDKLALHSVDQMHDFMHNLKADADPKEIKRIWERWHPYLELMFATLAAQPERGGRSRSEEHTSELQSLMRISYAVCCLKK